MLTVCCALTKLTSNTSNFDHVNLFLKSSDINEKIFSGDVRTRDLSSPLQQQQITQYLTATAFLQGLNIQQHKAVSLNKILRI